MSFVVIMQAVSMTHFTADSYYRLNYHQAKISGRLIPEADPGATRIGCDCTLGRNTVQGLLLRRLGEVIDTTQGIVPFNVSIVK